jgi:hypothetical protein
VDCDHVLDLMDRCRRCGHQMTDEELREREYDTLVNRNSPEARPSGERTEEREPGLF